MSDDKEFLLKEPVGKLLWQLALPTVAAQLINMLYNVIDRIYIGHMPQNGALAFTGVGVAMPVIMIVSAFAALISSGGAPRASIYLGMKDREQAERILGNSLAMQILISFVITVVLLIWHEDLMLLFGADPLTVPYASAYLKVYALGTLFVQVNLGMNAFITAQGFTKISMLSVTIGAVLNIILDPLFIFLLDLGVSGAALATIISQAVSCIWVLHFLCSTKSIIKLKRKNLRLHLKVIVPCLYLGLAAFFMQASESVITVCFNASLQHYGGNIAVGAMTVLSSVMMFAMLPLQGIAQGAQPITSYNYGAKQINRVKKTFTLLLAVSFTYSLIFGLSLILFPTFFVKIFNGQAEMVAFTARALRIYGSGIWLFGIQVACQMTFTAIGRAKQSIMAAVVRKFVLLLPLIYLLPRILSDKVTAVYLAEPISDIAAVIFTATLFIREFKQVLKESELTD